MKQSHKSRVTILGLLAVGLCLYCLVLAIASGNIGFEGDDWWVFSWPYWHSFPGSLWRFARDCLRPIEGVYWISLFEMFGLNRTVFHLSSLLLAAGGCIFMGMSLSRAFPGRTAFVCIAVLFAFFLPTVSPLTYVLATDNSRLSLLLFWACVLAYQRWAAGRESWHGLLGPWMLYALAFCTYEAPSFLLFAVPWFVLPVWHRNPDALPVRAFALRLGTGICGSFASVIAIRFLVLQGGAVGQSSLFPSWNLLWAYAALLPFYLIAPFSNVDGYSWEWIAGVLVALVAAAIYVASSRTRHLPSTSEQAPTNSDTPPSLPAHRVFHERGLYIAGLGASVLLLGLFPYQLAGYGAAVPRIAETAMIKWGLIPQGFPHWFNFNWSARIYSAGSYGVAILLAGGLTAWTRGTAKVVAALIAVTWIGFMAAFHSGLSRDWQEAAHMRNQLIASLVSQVPDVKPHTNFLCIDLECYYGRAPVFRNWNGLRELVRMIYSRNDLGAWYVYPYKWKAPNHLYHQAMVSPEGFVSRAMESKGPAAHDSLVILRRVGSSLVLEDQITEGDNLVPTGIRWDGASALQSNMNRIRGWWEGTDSQQKPVRNAWETGLITTLGLSHIPAEHVTCNAWESRESVEQLTQVLREE